MCKDNKFLALINTVFYFFLKKISTFAAVMKKLTIIIALLLGWQTTKAQLVINELMQSNIDCFMDDLKDFPDSWVELYNPTSSGINLSNYKIGTKEDGSDAWQLPNQVVVDHQYILVYCDKVGKGLHTDFRLESGKGCDVYLFQGGTIVDKVTGLKKQPSPNIAYGRKTDGADEWGYQLTPTPKAANSGEICNRDHILGEPVFSQQGQVYNGNNPFNLALSLPEGSPEGAEIHYTVDGSEPTIKSPKYTKEIAINQSTAIRAKLFCDGWLSPVSSVQSYIFHDRSLSIPIISIVTDNRYLNDSQIGIFANNNSHDKSKQVDWRRPINFELFDAEGQPAQLNQLCETRVTGAYSREASRKSMGIYCHKRFGQKNLNYEFFPDQCPGLTNYKSIVLRNAGNDRDYLYMRDAICQRTMAENGDIDWQAWRPSVVYINGKYWGMLNIRERANENNIITHYDGLEDVDVIENGELKEGTYDNYNAFKTFCEEHGHKLSEYAELMDWEEYLRITIMNQYFNNLDYPGNNNVCWRPRAEGGKWRFIAKDLDYTMGLYNGNSGESGGYDHRIIEQWFNPDDANLHKGANFSITWDGTRMFRRLMEDEDFKREFIDRFCIYMGDFLNEKRIREIWDPMYVLMRDEWRRHRSTVYDNPWWPNYDDELGKARSWISKRTAEMYKQIGSYFSLGNQITLSINKDSNSDAAEAGVVFNNVPLSRNTFDGKFFAGRKVTLEGIAPEGKAIAGWSVKTVSTSGTVSNKTVDGSRYEFDMPECSSLVINAVIGDPSGINDNLAETTWTWQKSDSQLVLMRVPAGTKVQFFDLRGMPVYSAIADGSDITIPLNSHNLHVLKVGSKAIKL